MVLIEKDLKINSNFQKGERLNNYSALLSQVLEMSSLSKVFFLGKMNNITFTRLLSSEKYEFKIEFEKKTFEIIVQTTTNDMK